MFLNANYKFLCRQQKQSLRDSWQPGIDGSAESAATVAATAAADRVEILSLLRIGLSGARCGQILLRMRFKAFVHLKFSSEFVCFFQFQNEGNDAQSFWHRVPLS